MQRYWRRFRYFQAHRLLRPWLSQPLGHFYSPIGDIDALAAERLRLWPYDECCTGIDFQAGAQTRLLRDIFPPLLEAFDYPEYTTDGVSYHLHNSQFGHADARALFALLRLWQPRRMIEVGSGYSTLLAADINRRFLDNALHLTAIEPFPRGFLQDLPGLQSLRIERVQDTPAHVFDALEAGDVLFIDSSHVLKTGSDLVHLLTQVLPRLASGVHLHFHDLFLPDEYPPQWVIDENRSWNEQYVVQAILASNPRYRVLYGTQYALTRLTDVAHAAFGSLSGQAYAGGSFWIDVQ